MPSTDLSATLQRLVGPSFVIGRELRPGGMSRLFLAEQTPLSRRVVVKVLPPELASEASSARFRREIAVTASLQHPHVLPVLAAGGEGDVLYYVVPYVAGESLKDRIARDGPLPPDEVATILRHLCDALAFAHGRGVVHRDVKPANILLLEGHAVLADFGIALALAQATERVTLSSAVPGTPAYMAPELPCDGTADLYALAVSGVEMLTGSLPPRPVTPPGVRAAVAAQWEGTASADRALRIGDVLGRALSLRPADRFASAAALLEALEGRVEEPHRQRVRRTPRWGSAVVLASTVLITSSWAPGRSGGPGERSRGGAVAADEPLVASRYLVAAAPADDGTVVAADDVRRALAAAVGEWDDVYVVESAMGDGAARAGPPDGVATEARRHRAAYAIVAEVATAGDSVVVRATLHDVARDSVVRRDRVGFAARGAPLPAEYRRLVSRLLRGTDHELPNADGEGTTSLAAWRAYDAARAAIERWDVTAAERLLRRSLAADPDHALAHVWLAQTLTWADSVSVAERREAAARAVVRRSQLGDADAARGAGLLALAEGRHPEACAEFARVLRADSTDVGGWVGLGDCHSHDSLVVRDVRTPSGWAFRGSHHTAARMYAQATALLRRPPPDFLYHRFARVWFTQANRRRIGYVAGDPRPVPTYPSLVADTLAFVPYVDRTRGGLATVPAGRDSAVAYGARRLRDAYAAWARAAPTSVAARHALSQALEATGNIAQSGADDLTAIGEVRAARRLARDSLVTIELVATEVRQLLKSGQLGAARALADSALAAWRDAPVTHADPLVGLAALTGRAGRLRALLVTLSGTPKYAVRAHDGRPLELPPAVLRERAEALADAALGACTARLRGLDRRLATLLDAQYRDPAAARVVREALIVRPHSLAVPCLGTGAVAATGSTRDPLVALQRRASAGRAALHAELDALERVRANVRPADRAVDYVFGEAWLLAAAGDTARAYAHLAPSLDGLESGGPLLLSEVGQAAAVVRALALGARLAAARGDRPAARRWASAVVALWSGADAELQPVVAEARGLLGEVR